MKVLVPTAVPEGLTLDADLADIEVITYDQDASIPAEHRDAEILVAWMNPREKVLEIAATMPALRLVQCLGSGPESFLTAGFAHGVLIARGIDLHNVPVAEHALALLLAAARRLDLTRDAQRDSRWATELTGNQLVSREGFTTIAGSRFVIWGLGRIGLTLAGYLRALGASVAGIGRERDERDGVEVVPAAEARELLSQADALITVLPDRPGAAGAIDRSVLDLLPSHAWLVNVGRGSTVVEDDLVAAIRSGSIGGAALDVFATEPLPEQSPLWQLPNVIITPHSAGGRPTGSAELINENLRRLRSGDELLGLLR